MTVKLVRGDIVSSEVPVQVIPVNRAGIAGAGLAYNYREKYPEWLQAYRVWCNDGCPGDGFMTGGDGVGLLPAITKDHPRNKSTKIHVVNACAAILRTCDKRGITVIAVPALGCGLGGLDWKEVIPYMTHMLWEIPTVYIFMPQGRL